MKAMKTVINHNGDDVYFNRLLSYFKSVFTEDILQLVQIRKSVFLLTTKKNTFLVKGYKLFSRLRLQEAFSETLRKEGFIMTSRFVPPPAREHLFFEGLHFGCMEYIEPHPNPFSFSTQKGRKEGIDLLSEYHRVTSTFETRYRTLVPKEHVYEKWRERLTIFSENLPLLKYFIDEKVFLELVSWGNWSLDGMARSQAFFVDEPFVILHGDVAHHNFLRDKKGNLHLIDFDLISIGPAQLDYLQFANRILPFMDWSLNKLFHIKQYWPYLNEKAFLYALAFPADIFREWNRVIREKNTKDQLKINQLMELTAGQFYLRKKFTGQLKEIVFK